MFLCYYFLLHCYFPFSLTTHSLSLWPTVQRGDISCASSSSTQRGGWGCLVNPCKTIIYHCIYNDLKRQKNDNPYICLASLNSQPARGSKIPFQPWPCLSSDEACWSPVLQGPRPTKGFTDQGQDHRLMFWPGLEPVLDLHRHHELVWWLGLLVESSLHFQAILASSLWLRLVLLPMRCPLSLTHPSWSAGPSCYPTNLYPQFQ